MSETFKKKTKRPAWTSLRSIALLGPLLCGSIHAIGEDLETYGTRMCVEAGIPLVDCSLVSDPTGARNQEFDGRGDKTATLVEHGRRVCEQENVPIEDCQALPADYRVERDAPAPAFLTVPETLPAVDAALLPAPAPAPSPVPVARRVVRGSPPPAPVPIAPARVSVARAPVDNPDIRYLRPAPPAQAAYHYAPAAAPAVALPIEPETGYARPSIPPAEPFAFREVAPPLDDRRLPLVFVEERRERFQQGERLRRQERFIFEERSGRCLRAVRYSAPPSYRYITC